MFSHWFSLLLFFSLSDVCEFYACWGSEEDCYDGSNCLSCYNENGCYRCGFHTFYLTFIFFGIILIGSLIVFIIVWRTRSCCFKRPPPLPRPPQQQQQPYPPGTPPPPQPFFYAPVQPQPMATHQQQPVQQTQPDTQPQEPKSPYQEQGNEIKSTTVVSNSSPPSTAPSETHETHTDTMN